MAGGPRRRIPSQATSRTIDRGTAKRGRFDATVDHRQEQARPHGGPRWTPGATRRSATRRVEGRRNCARHVVGIRASRVRGGPRDQRRLAQPLFGLALRGLPSGEAPPPRVDRLHAGGLDRAAKARREQVRARGLCEGRESLDRLVPGVESEVECAPVHREEGAAAKQTMSLEGVVGTEVNLPPRGVKSADLEHHEVEGPAALANRLEVGRQPCVAAEEDAMFVAAHHERRPRGPVRAGAAPGEVPCGGRCEGEATAGQHGSLPPIQLDDPRRVDAPRLEVRADAERREERGLSSSKLHDGRVVEVVEVIVRDDDGVEVGELSGADRRAMKALRASP